MSQRARELAAVLLDHSRDARELRPELLELVELCGVAAPVVVDRSAGIAAGEHAGPEGLALSTPMAAACAEDYLRTLYFQRGVARAVAERARPGRPVRVLYAGCGPWAALLLPTLLLARPGEIEAVLLELQPDSLQCIRKLVSSWGLEGVVTELRAGDALEWRLEAGEASPDVLVLETMQAGLFAEPQVALTRQLLAQAPRATLVPRRVEVRLAVGDAAGEFTDPGPDLGVAFALDREAALGWRGLAGDRLPGARVALPPSLPPGATPFWRTHIEVADGLVLQGTDSGLTSSLRAELGGPLVPGGAVECSYQLGPTPGMRGHVLAAAAKAEPRLLWVDGLAALTVGVLVLALSGPLSRLHGLPRLLLVATGLVNLLYASHSLPLARRERAQRPPDRVLLLVGANAGWAVACLVLGVLYFGAASWFGRAHLFGEALFVGALAVAEWKQRRSLAR